MQLEMETKAGGGGEGAHRPSKFPRKKRVRSLNRKRGCRGGKHAKKGAKKQEQAQQQQEQGETCPPGSSGRNGQQGLDNYYPLEQDDGVKRPKRRTRERKSRTWKPYSEMTWQERLEKEQQDEEKARAAEEQRSLGSNVRKKRKKGQMMEIPKAPRNTTQNLIHSTSDVFEDERETAVGVPSMHGLLSRQTMRLTHADLDDDDSSDDSERDTRQRIDEDEDIANAASPASPGGEANPYDDDGDGGIMMTNGEHTSQDPRDEQIAALKEENEMLRQQIRSLEDAQANANR